MAPSHYLNQLIGLYEAIFNFKKIHIYTMKSKHESKSRKVNTALMSQKMMKYICGPPYLTDPLKMLFWSCDESRNISFKVICDHRVVSDSSLVVGLCDLTA